MRLKGRGPRELAFRSRQAIANASIWAFPPAFSDKVTPSGLHLPDPLLIRELLAGSPFQEELKELAGGILKHRIPLLGSTVDLGPDIEWRRDPVHGKSSSTRYFRFVPYLDFNQVGDHKNIWELNRHQHLVVLAQAHLLTGDPTYRDEIGAQLESWWEQNPFLKGMNWASALEVAFRALSWLWIDHLIGLSLDHALRRRIWNSLYEHGAYLNCNLSTYFSPNTHVLGEGVALHAIGFSLNQKDWIRIGGKTVDETLKVQVRADGSHFEQSTYYHLYALDFFLFHYVVAGRPEAYRVALRKMARFLAAIVGPERLLTRFGDDDGGRLFHPYGSRDLFARATLSTCAILFPEEGLPLETEDLAVQAVWWLGCKAANRVEACATTCLFPDSGLASVATARTHILTDAGAFGFGGAGHSHADTLSITARSGSRELLIDPGTFTYISDPGLRNSFRSTGFHNTIRIDGRDQADPGGPFRWNTKPAVHVNEWRVDGISAFLDASCDYRGFSHRRRLLVLGDEVFFVLDEITGPVGQHQIDQFWHLGDRGVRVLFSDPAAVNFEEGLYSPVFGRKEPAPVVRVSWSTGLPHLCAAAVSFGELDAQATLRREGFELWIPGTVSVSFAVQGMPLVSRP